jgi:DNA invertase Pin-like site-specific DNA recombinase
VRYVPPSDDDEQRRIRRAAEQALVAWRATQAHRDAIVRDAFAAGVGRMEIHRLSGIARSTINRILDQPPGGDA